MNFANSIRVLKFLTRLKAAYRILFRKYDHWVILDVKKPELIKCLKDENFDVDVLYHGVQPYIYHKMIRMVAASKDSIEIALDKAQFEADSEEYNKKNGK